MRTIFIASIFILLTTIAQSSEPPRGLGAIIIAFTEPTSPAQNSQDALSLAKGIDTHPQARKVEPAPRSKTPMDGNDLESHIKSFARDIPTLKATITAILIAMRNENECKHRGLWLNISKIEEVTEILWRLSAKRVELETDFFNNLSAEIDASVERTKFEKPYLKGCELVMYYIQNVGVQLVDLIYNKTPTSP